MLFQHSPVDEPTAVQIFHASTNLLRKSKTLWVIHGLKQHLKASFPMFNAYGLLKIGTKATFVCELGDDDHRLASHHNPNQLENI